MPSRGLTEYFTANPEKNQLGLVGSLPPVSGEALTPLVSCMTLLKAWNTFTPMG